MAIHKGDKVTYTATVRTDYPFNEYGNRSDGGLLDYEIIASPSTPPHHNDKCLVRDPLKSLMRGVVIGKTYRAVGIYHPGHRGGIFDDDWEESHLTEFKRVPLWVIVPLNDGDAYRKPVLVHEDDIQEVVYTL